MARSKANAKIVNTVSRMLVRGGYCFAGFTEQWYGRQYPVLSRRKRFLLMGTDERVSVGPRTTCFYSVRQAVHDRAERKKLAGQRWGVRLKSADFEEVTRVMEERKAAAGCGV
jgi:hypothetical protein